MWWYICRGALDTPTPTWLLEYPPIEARLLLGAMTYKYDAHGVPLLHHHELRLLTS